MLGDRYDSRSTMIASQMPVEVWHEAMGGPALADVILDRLVHSSYRVDIKGGSKRQLRGLAGPGIIDPSENH